jgi:hypothetical protein
MGATDSGRAVFAGGGDGVNDVMAAAWLRPAQREREEAGGRGAGTMTIGEADGGHPGLPSEAQHRCAGTKSTLDEDPAVGEDDNDAMSNDAGADERIGDR